MQMNIIIGRYFTSDSAGYRAHPARNYQTELDLAFRTVIVAPVSFDPSPAIRNNV